MRISRSAYSNQMGSAKARGIEWKFTFKTWLEWWGDDLNKRGGGQFDLQMQRHADTGPYSPENCRKGTPKQNSVTAGAMKRKRITAQAAAELSLKRDVSASVVKEYEFDHMTEDEIHLHLSFGIKSPMHGLWDASTR